jgi:predicted N-acetyltransferase YhbS/predicted kinase
MTHVYAMCGIAFSGKSTMARRIVAELGIELISLDAINAERGLHGGDGLADAQWEETSLIAMDRLRTLLREGKSVVVDDTFSHRFLRDRCKAVVDEYGGRFSIVFVDTPRATIQERRVANSQFATRSHLRDDVFEHHRRRFQFPDNDEPHIRIVSDQDLAAWIAREKAERTSTGHAMEIIKLRPVERRDQASTRNLVDAAFNPEDVASFLDALRRDGCLLGEWLAEDSTGPLAFIAFSRVHVEKPGSERVAAAMLTPLAVRPDRQRSGIGTRLMHHAIHELEQRGETLFFVLGHPQYYPRAGFHSAATGRVIAPWSGNPAFMARGASAPEGRLVLPAAIAKAH